jgi:hypothetical protein
MINGKFNLLADHSVHPLRSFDVLRYGRAIARHVVLAAWIGLWLTEATKADAASLSSRDAQIIAKVVGFLDPAPSGKVIAVLYARGEAASKSDADAIVRLFDGGISSGGGTITAKAIEAGSLGDGAGYIAIIFAIDAGPAHQPEKLLTITAVDDLVRSGQAVMAVHSQPRVEIIVNRAAAQAAGIGFTAAFGMLVHEI